jgi:hypothetical protein
MLQREILKTTPIKKEKERRKEGRELNRTVEGEGLPQVLKIWILHNSDLAQEIQLFFPILCSLTS